MKLILMRHGQAGYHVDGQPVSDAQRQLTDFGRQQAQQVAKSLLDHYQPQLCVVSPYIRAKQTLAAFELTSTSVVESSAITPDANPLKALHQLLDISLEVNEARKAAGEAELQCVLVVCHMPIVAKMAALLSAQPAEAYALAEARIFDTEIIAADMGEEVDRMVAQQP